MRSFVLILALLAGPAAAQTLITEAEARAFVARQERLWNAGDLDAYFAGFAPEATFTDQAYVGDKPPVPYGTSTRAEAERLARRAQSRGRPTQTGRVLRVEIAPGGASAKVVLAVGSTAPDKAGPRRLCAARTVTLVRDGAALRAREQVDTYVKCRGG
ncbi:MAG: hypothetical protein ACOY5Y_13675 [Pseudomonadota bacterium]|jgi:hypothetical protein